MPNAKLIQTFTGELRRWLQSGSDVHLSAALRSPCSGVPHDVAAAYATAAARIGPLLDAIARTRIAVNADERDALLRFWERVRSIDEHTSIQALFELEPSDDVADDSSEMLAFDLAESATPDMAGPVRARQTHFSASALNAYAECPRKWFYRYSCAAIEDAGSSASTYGTAFHAALEDFHAEFPQPSPALEAAMRQKIVGYVNWAFERYRNEFDTAVEVELHKRRAQRTAQKYVDWLIAESKRAPFTVIGREIGAQLDLDGFNFVGYIDRIDRDDATGTVAIIDYKTGSIATTAAEYREKVRKFRDFQLPFYYWARTAEGDRVARLALIPLKDALLDVRPVSLEVVPLARTEAKRNDAPVGTITVAELELARAKMIEICSDLTSGRLQRFAVTTDADACTYCAYADACADRPHDERERFGR
ncbi:MAG TPA: PD-(D/E)XK nuclease family protein [Candidatus Aquilonibacter sp.]|nr:PD-(D/E)XK nuclease family protein [Candidatus Aquilonibacter sp.]